MLYCESFWLLTTNELRVTSLRKFLIEKKKKKKMCQLCLAALQTRKLHFLAEDDTSKVHFLLYFTCSLAHKIVWEKTKEQVAVYHLKLTYYLSLILFYALQTTDNHEEEVEVEKRKKEEERNARSYSTEKNWSANLEWQ